jgi:hypothetical protein
MRKKGKGSLNWGLFELHDGSNFQFFPAVDSGPSLGYHEWVTVTDDVSDAHGSRLGRGSY